MPTVTGALRAYLVRRGDAVDGVVIRALVPVNLRPLEQAYRLGNKFGLVFLDLPIDCGVHPLAIRLPFLFDVLSDPLTGLVKGDFFLLRSRPIRPAGTGFPSKVTFPESL